MRLMGLFIGMLMVGGAAAAPYEIVSGTLAVGALWIGFVLGRSETTTGAVFNLWALHPYEGYYDPLRFDALDTAIGVGRADEDALSFIVTGPTLFDSSTDSSHSTKGE